MGSESPSVGTYSISRPGGIVNFMVFHIDRARHFQRVQLNELVGDRIVLLSYVTVSCHM